MIDHVEADPCKGRDIVAEASSEASCAAVVSHRDLASSKIEETNICENVTGLHQIYND